jgi:hypothetical protein
MSKIFYLNGSKSSDENKNLNDMSKLFSEILAECTPELPPQENKPKNTKYYLYFAISIALIILLLLTLNVYAHNIYITIQNTCMIVVSENSDSINLCNDSN